MMLKYERYSLAMLCREIGADFRRFYYFVKTGQTPVGQQRFYTHEEARRLADWWAASARLIPSLHSVFHRRVEKALHLGLNSVSALRAFGRKSQSRIPLKKFWNSIGNLLNVSRILPIAAVPAIPLLPFLFKSFQSTLSQDVVLCAPIRC